MCMLAAKAWVASRNARLTHSQSRAAGLDNSWLMSSCRDDSCPMLMCVMAAQKPPATVTVTKQQQAFLITQKHIIYICIVCMWAHINACMCVYAYNV